MTSTYDHRVIQGAESGAFLAEIDRLLQGADGFYDEVRAAAWASAPPVVKAAPAAAAPVAPGRPPRARSPTTRCSTGVAAAMSLGARRTASHGHLAARLDPLGSEPPGDPALSAENVGLTPEIMARIPASLLRVKVPGESFAAALPHLRKAYCGTIAYEIEHLSDHQQAALAARRDRVGPPTRAASAPERRSTRSSSA